MFSRQTMFLKRNIKSTKKLYYSSVTISEQTRLKYRGVLLGSLAGNCIGDRCYLGKRYDAFSEVNKLQVVETGSFKFAGDTALTKAVCKSLIDSKALNIANMADNLITAFVKEPNRGYATGAMNLFSSLYNLKNENNFEMNCYNPALEMFNGTGSYGNGSGMRASPLALYTLNKSEEEMILIVILATKLTHSNYLAVMGALLECFAIRLAFHIDEKLFDSDPNLCLDNYFGEIINKIEYLENIYPNFEQKILENIDKYRHVCPNLENYLKQFIKYAPLTDTKIDRSYSERLKNMRDIINNYSLKGEIIMPTMPIFSEEVPNCDPLFCFLISANKNLEREVFSKFYVENPFQRYGNLERAIFYSMGMMCGRDRESLASLFSMAGAIAGAFFNSESTKMPHVLKSCEGYEDAITYADTLFQLSFKR